MPPKFTNGAIIRVTPVETGDGLVNQVDIITVAMSRKSAIWRSRIEASDIILIRNQKVIGAFKVDWIRDTTVASEIILSENHPQYEEKLRDVKLTSVRRMPVFINQPIRNTWLVTIQEGR